MAYFSSVVIPKALHVVRDAFVRVFKCLCVRLGRRGVGFRLEVDFLLLAENKQIKKPGKSDCWDLVYFFFLSAGSKINTCQAVNVSNN